MQFIKELTTKFQRANIIPGNYGENVRYVTPYVGYKNDNANPLESSSDENASQEKESKYREPQELGYKLPQQIDPFENAFKILSEKFQFNPIHYQTKDSASGSDEPEEETANSIEEDEESLQKSTSTSNKISTSILLKSSKAAEKIVDQNQQATKPKSESLPISTTLMQSSSEKEKSTAVKKFTRPSIVSPLNLSSALQSSSSTTHIKSKSIKEKTVKAETDAIDEEKAQKEKPITEKKRFIRPNVVPPLPLPSSQPSSSKTDINPKQKKARPSQKIGHSKVSGSTSRTNLFTNTSYPPQELPKKSGIFSIEKTSHKKEKKSSTSITEPTEKTSSPSLRPGSDSDSSSST